MRFLRRWRPFVAAFLAFALLLLPYSEARASNVTGTGSVTLNFSQTPASGVLANVPIPLQEQLRSVFRASGVTADEVDGIIYKQLTFSASTPQTLDLTAQTDVLGNSITVARVRFVAIKVYWTTDNVPLLVGNAATNAWTGFLGATSILSVYPSSTNNDGYFILQAPQTTGMPVSGTSKSLKLDPQTASGQVDLIICTCSS